MRILDLGGRGVPAGPSTAIAAPLQWYCAWAQCVVLETHGLVFHTKDITGLGSDNGVLWALVAASDVAPVHRRADHTEHVQHHGEAVR